MAIVEYGVFFKHHVYDRYTIFTINNNRIMKKIFAILMLSMGMLSLNAQTEETKDTVYIDFNPHIARLDNEIAENGILGIEVSNIEYTYVEDHYESKGYDLIFYYTCDELYIPLTPDMEYNPASGIICADPWDIIGISNVNGEVTEVDGKTVFDFTCDGSDGKVYSIHAEAYLPEVKEEINLVFDLEWAMEFDDSFTLSGKCGDYGLILDCTRSGETYDGTYNYVNNEGAATSLFYVESPVTAYIMLQFEYTVTTREDGYYDIYGDILLEDGRLFHFYISSNPEGTPTGMPNMTDGNIRKVRKVFRNGRAMIEADGHQYGIDGSMR